MATVTPIASVRTILDAANDAAASSGVLALMEDQDVEVASLELPRTGGLVKPVDTLTLDAAGRLVVNDNDRPGGRLVSNDRRFRGMHVVADISNTFYEKLVTIPLTSAECAVNATYQLVGTIRALMPGTPSPVTFGVLTQSIDTILVDDPAPSLIYQLSLTEFRTDLHINVIFKNTSGVLTVLPYPDGGFIGGVTYDNAGVGAGFTASVFDAEASFPTEAQNLYLHLGSYGGGVGDLAFDYDLELIVTKP